MANPKIAQMADVPKACFLVYSRRRPLRFEGARGPARQKQGMGRASESNARKDQHMMETVFAFDELTAESQAPAGAKGGTLTRLYQAGYPVPDGLMILLAAFVVELLEAG